MLYTEHAIPQADSNARLDMYGHVDITVIKTMDYTGDLTKIEKLNKAYCPIVQKMIIGKATVNGNIIPCTYYVRPDGDVTAYTGTPAATKVAFVCAGSYSIK